MFTPRDAAHHSYQEKKVGGLDQRRRHLMKNDIHFWLATVVLGALALIMGSAVMVIPDMARTLLLLPFAVAISILCLAAYGDPRQRCSFYNQLYGVTQNSKNRSLHWFLYLIAFQALCAAITEIRCRAARVQAGRNRLELCGCDCGLGVHGYLFPRCSICWRDSVATRNRLAHLWVPVGIRYGAVSHCSANALCRLSS